MMLVATELQTQTQIPLFDMETPLFEAAAVHHARSETYRGYASLNIRPSPKDRLIEEMFPVERMPWVIEEALKTHRDTHDMYIAQHSYMSKLRRTTNLLSLNIGHIDLDIYYSDYADESQAATIDALLRKLDEHKIPLPSYIVSSGRGLQAKWIWNAPVSPKALPRWQAAHRYIVDEVLYEFAADAKAILPTQILRLVGSTNLKTGERVKVVWVNGGDLQNAQTIDFEAWLKAVFPFSRDEVREFKAKFKQYDAWHLQNEQNRALRAELLGANAATARAAREAAWRTLGAAIGMDVEPSKLAVIDDLTAGEIWQRRLNTMDELIKLRGHQHGLPAGSNRHGFVWVAANAFGWINRELARPLLDDLATWTKIHVPSYSHQEAQSVASAVIKRSTEAQGVGTGLYRMAEPTFMSKIGMTEEEAAQLSHASAKRRQEARPRNEGVMGLPPIRGLSFDEYKEVTSDYQRQGAHYSNQQKVAKSAPKREEAHRMSAEGLTVREIGKALGVGKSTVARWLS